MFFVFGKIINITVRIPPGMHLQVARQYTTND